MKKRFFAIFLAVCLVVTLLPAGVLAADVEYVYVGGEELTSTDGGTVYATTDDEGNVTKLESAEGATITWNGETLTLNGATIKGNYENGIVYRDGDLTIWLEGTNKIGKENDGNSAASGIRVDGSLIVTGDGTLDVVGLNRGITAGNATFSGGTVNAIASADSISGSARMGISAGSVTAKGKENGIQTQGNVNISGGEVVAEGGNVGIWVTLYKELSIKITGGEVTVTGGWRSFNENVTIGPEKDPAITIEYGDSANDDDKIERVVYGGETYKYNGNDHYFHSSTETDISKLANITVGGVGLYGTDYRIAYAKTDNDGNVTVGGSEDNYNIKWDGTTLTLKGATIKVDKPHDGIEYSGNSAITIQLEGENTVTGSNGIRTNESGKNLTISGSGTLNVNGDSSAIYAAKNIEISDATVNATGTNSDGIYTYGGDIIINSGKVTVECKDDGLNASVGNVVINGGDVSVDSGGDGVYAGFNHSLTIRGGTVTIEADTKLIYVTDNNRTVTIAPQDGAEITVKAGDSEGSTNNIDIPTDGNIINSVSGAKYFHSVTSGGTSPAITNVTVTPGTAEVEVGETKQFTATVTGTGYYNKSVVWTVSGNESTGTFISSNGVLNIATDETATTLTVKATAVGNSGKSATATVTVTPPATITGVTVDPNTAEVEAGETLRFTATVSGTGGVSKEVTWSVSGSNAGTTISEDGVLTVATGETAETLTVKATAKGDGITSGTATVTVTQPATITGVTVDPAAATVEAGKTQQFTAKVEGTGNFREEVTWSVSGNESDDTTISEDGVLNIAADETAATLTVTATANGDDTKYATATVTVTQPDPDEPWSPGGGTTGNRYCYLTFETRGGSEIASLRVKLGETVSLDEYLSERDGFDFAGWYSDDSFAERVDELYMNGSKTVYAAWEPFDDAGRGDWFYDSVVYVYENGLMDGVSDTLFDPDGTVTRGMIVTILHRLEGEPESDFKLPFDDVKEGQWYAEAVRWAAGEGIVNGVSETEFAPNAAVTREQLAAILHRYAQHKGYDVSIGESTNILSYSDFASISEYAISAMQWACGEGIITGVTESTLEPQGTATRAQSAAILMRFIEG